MITGSCHCGAVAFELSGAVTDFEHCHCQTCRKIHGTAFGSSAVVAKEHFHIRKGEDELSEYKSSSTKIRYFCSHCGSHLFAVSSTAPDDVILRIGTLDPGHGLRPESHIYVEDKPDWYEILDDLPQYQTEP
jgi:hypothetical protein